MKHELHEIWKVIPGLWRVQCPNGIMTFKTKKAAKLWVDVAEGVRDHLGNPINESPFRGEE